MHRVFCVDLPTHNLSFPTLARSSQIRPQRALPSHKEWQTSGRTLKRYAGARPWEPLRHGLHISMSDTCSPSIERSSCRPNSHMRAIRESASTRMSTSTRSTVGQPTRACRRWPRTLKKSSTLTTPSPACGRRTGPVWRTSAHRSVMTPWRSCAWVLPAAVCCTTPRRRPRSRRCRLTNPA